MSDIDVMKGEEFEQYLMILFQNKGYKVKTTPKSGDYGADLILEKDRKRIVVQAKRYKSKVSNGAVQGKRKTAPYPEFGIRGCFTLTYQIADKKTYRIINKRRYEC